MSNPSSVCDRLGAQIHQGTAVTAFVYAANVSSLQHNWMLLSE